MSCFYGATLQKDTSCVLPCSWATSDPSLFLIRGPSYLHDQQKVFLQYQIIYGSMKREREMGGGGEFSLLNVLAKKKKKEKEEAC